MKYTTRCYVSKLCFMCYKFTKRCMMLMFMKCSANVKAKHQWCYTMAAAAKLPCRRCSLSYGPPASTLSVATCPTPPRRFSDAVDDHSRRSREPGRSPALPSRGGRRWTTRKNMVFYRGLSEGTVTLVNSAEKGRSLILDFSFL